YFLCENCNFCTDRRRACFHGRGGVPHGMLSARGRGAVTASSRLEAVRNAPLVDAAPPARRPTPGGPRRCPCPPIHGSHGGRPHVLARLLPTSRRRARALRVWPRARPLALALGWGTRPAIGSCAVSISSDWPPRSPWR